MPVEPENSESTASDGASTEIFEIRNRERLIRFRRLVTCGGGPGCNEFDFERLGF